MNRSQSLADSLCALLVTQTRGLLSYLAVADPYVTSRTCHVFDQLRRMASQCSDHAQRLVEVMQDLHIVPPSVSFAPDAANYTFLSIETLLPRLLDEQRDQIAAYRTVLEHLGDQEPARHQIEVLLEVTEAQSQELLDAAASLGATDAGPV